MRPNAIPGFQVTTDGYSASCLYKKEIQVGLFAVMNRHLYLRDLAPANAVEQNEEEQQLHHEAYLAVLDDENLDDEIVSDWQPVDEDPDLDEDVAGAVPVGPPLIRKGRLSDERKAEWNQKLQPIIAIFDRILTIDPNAIVMIQFTDKDGRTGRYTTDQYYHDARFNESRTWSNQRIEDDVEVSEVMETFRSDDIHHSDLARFIETALKRLSHFRLLDTFFNEIHNFRSERFRVYTRRQVAFTKVADMISEHRKFKNVAIGFGNWGGTRNYRIRRKKPPIIALRKFLAARFEFFALLDEYLTSKKCSECRRGRTHNVLLPWTEKSPESLYYYEGTLILIVGDRSNLVDTYVTRNKRSHQFVACDDPDCLAHWWRDLNPVINMMDDLSSQVAGEPRPAHLARPNNNQP